MYLFILFFFDFEDDVLSFFVVFLYLFLVGFYYLSVVLLGILVKNEGSIEVLEVFYIIIYGLWIWMLFDRLLGKLFGVRFVMVFMLF